MDRTYLEFVGYFYEFLKEDPISEEVFVFGRRLK